MAALSSYTPIATYTVPSGTPTSYTFTSIPQIYTDLILVTSFAGNYPSNDRSQLGIQVGNGSVDTGSNYSVTLMTGNGSTATSSRTTSSNQLSLATFPLGPSSSLQQNNLTVHFQNYSNTTTNKTVLARATQMNSSNNTPSTVAEVGLWRSTSAIDTIKIKDYSDLYYFYAGTTFSLYGIANNTAGAKATGGVISSDSSYFYHSFYATGTFTPTQSLSCDYLVIAGGGSGGRDTDGGTGAGGGGAGGYLTSIGGSPLSVTATAYTITVGAGGASQTAARTQGNDGTSSTFSTVTATGGGGGGAYNTSSGQGRTGGSGGGGGGQNGATGGTATASPVQGNNGGTGTIAGIGPGGGGGGAGAVGAAGTGNGGAGGNGLASSLTAGGISITRAGGGGGGAFNATAAVSGGSGGGGQSGLLSVAGTAGTINTGSGGGGGGSAGTPNPLGSGNSGAGGSGVVIIRYAR